MFKKRLSPDSVTLVINSAFGAAAFAGANSRKKFLKNYSENLRSLFMIFAVLVTVFCCGNITVTNAQVIRKNVPLDFTGDGRTDWATFSTNFSLGTAPIRWKITGNPASAEPNAAFKREFDYGFSNDTIVPRDYTGDRKTDVAVWRIQSFGLGIYYVAQFPIGTDGITLERTVRWGGLAGDRAGAEGDYDGDGKVDYTIVRMDPNTRRITWFILSSITGNQRAIQFGVAPPFGEGGFLATEGADFNGDGKDELVLIFYNDAQNSPTYYIGDANTGVDILTLRYGLRENDYSIPPADYTGDGIADIVVVRHTDHPMTWYIRNTATGVTTATSFGIGNPTPSTGFDYPVRGDYDGDGRHDIAIWRQSNQTFYYLRSSSNNTVVDGQKHGDPGDIPLGFYRP